MTVIANNMGLQACRDLIAAHAVDWINSRSGRCAKPLSGVEIGFYSANGKMACTMWIDPYPEPVGANKFQPANGGIPGLNS